MAPSAICFKFSSFSPRQDPSTNTSQHLPNEHNQNENHKKYTFLHKHAVSINFHSALQYQLQKKSLVLKAIFQLQKIFQQIKSKYVENEIDRDQPNCGCFGARKQI